MVVLAALALALQANGVVNDDRDVIQACMLSFFNQKFIEMRDWKPKAYVVLHPDRRNDDRRDFNFTLDNMYARVKQAKEPVKEAKTKEGTVKIKTDLDLLTQYGREFEAIAAVRSEKLSGSYRPPKAVPYELMKWDRKIKVTEADNWYGRGEGDEKKLEQKTAYASTDLPCYSGNGKYACLTLRLPWSIHEAVMTLLLRRDKSGWMILAVTEFIFV